MALYDNETRKKLIKIVLAILIFLILLSIVDSLTTNYVVPPIKNIFVDPVKSYCKDPVTDWEIELIDYDHPFNNNVVPQKNYTVPKYTVTSDDGMVYETKNVYNWYYRYYYCKNDEDIQNGYLCGDYKIYTGSFEKYFQLREEDRFQMVDDLFWLNVSHLDESNYMALGWTGINIQSLPYLYSPITFRTQYQSLAREDWYEEEDIQFLMWCNISSYEEWYHNFVDLKDYSMNRCVAYMYDYQKRHAICGEEY